MKKYLFLSILIVVLSSGVARADVSFFLLEAVGVAGESTGSGHAAIYLSNICADGPVQLRLCQPGEKGVVISNYPGFAENAPYEWLAVPVLPYLYGVENERDIPLYANGKIRNFLREAYRQKHLRSVIADSADGTMPKGGWKTMLTMAFNRDIYSFNVKTTPEEDAKFLKEFTSLPNEDRFNSFNRNCADFIRHVINRYFPDAARRNVINDFGITTPKAIARSFSGFATDRPELLFSITKYSQVAGPIWRSYDNRNFSETAFTSKKYVIPTLLFEPPLLGIFAGAYLVSGRFDAHQQYKKYPNAEIARLVLEENLLKQAEHNSQGTKLNAHSSGVNESHARLKEIATKKEIARLRQLGDEQIWKRYGELFAPILARALHQRLFVDETEVKTFFRDLEIQSEPALDENGALILKVRDHGAAHVLGLTRDNIMSQNSDIRLAYKLMLAKVYADVNAKEKNRNSLVTFESDWALLDRLSANYAASAAPLEAGKAGARFLEVPVKTSTKRNIQKLLISIMH